MKTRQSVKLVLLLAGAGALVSLACGSSSTTPGPVNPGATGGTVGGGGGQGGGLSFGGQAGGGAGGGGGLVFGGQGGGAGGSGGLVFGGQGGGGAAGGSAGAGMGGGGMAGGGGAGGGAVGMGGSVGTNVPVGMFSQSFATVYCQRVLQCCAGVQNISMESCVNEVKGIADLAVGEYQPLIANGKVVYHGDRAATCFNALNAATCAVINAGSASLSSGCDAAFESTVAPGGMCMDDLECKDGWCDQTGMMCVAKKAAGAPCEDDADCLSDNCSVASMTCAADVVEGLCPGP